MSQCKIVRADDIGSWPRDLTELLEKNLEQLRGFHDQRRQIDREGVRHISARMEPRLNEFQQSMDDILREASDLVLPHKIVGFHCTRLTPAEVGNIQANGLSPLSQELVKSRVRAAQHDGLIDRRLADKIIGYNQCKERGRAGLLWFIFIPGILRDQGAVERFFRSWGGEAIYWGREGDADGTALTRIGEPTIVEAAVPAEKIQTYCSVGERFANFFLHGRGVQISANPQWEGYVKDHIPEVIRVITAAQKEFVELTDSENWISKIR